jgi:hypothetical protein
MNESTLTQLKVLIERVVRPVHAPPRRRMKMREELLGHVIAVYEEEAAKLDQADDALERTRRRFGDPAEVTASLRASLPAFERIAGGLQHYLCRRPEETVWRFALRHACLAGAYVGGLALLGVLFVLLVMLLLASPIGREHWFALACVSALAPAGFLLAAIAMLLAHGMVHAIRQSDARRWWQLGPVLFTSALVGPMVVIGISLVAAENLVKAVVEALPSLPLVALLPPFVYIAFADVLRRVTADELRRSWLYAIAVNGGLAAVLGLVMLGVSLLVTGNFATSMNHAGVIVLMVVTWLMPFDLFLSAPCVLARLRADQEWSRLPIEHPGTVPA